MRIEQVVKEIVYISIMVMTIRASQWLTTSHRPWTPVLTLAFTYLLIRIFFIRRNSPAR